MLLRDWPALRPHVREGFRRARQDWRRASPPERICRILALLWDAALVAVILGDPGILLRGNHLWVSLPVFLRIVVGSQILLWAGLALSTRRR